MPSTLFYLSVVFSTLVSLTAKAAFTSKIYGVNLGSWLLIEPWMLPQEWGGESCSDCSQCIASEFAFAKAYPDTVDDQFNDHWNTWFNQQDVNDLVDTGINTVRIPLGYWIVEDLVDRSTEFYPRGGLKQLRRGLKQLKDAGIVAILDHHALPGVQSPQQMFTGRCTTDVQFYTPYNYHRALIWTAVMTTLSHIDPNFGSVTAIEAVNEPIMNANQTPGYGDFQKHFIQVVRATELALGVHVDDMKYKSPKHSISVNLNLTVSIQTIVSGNDFHDEVLSVLNDAIPIIMRIADQFSLALDADSDAEPLTTNFMDVNWQYNNRSNPADAAIGPQIYDNHLYYSFGGVADPNPDAYMTHLCNLDRIQKDAELGNSPLFIGEWGLPTQFNATDEFLFKWADAQKLQYSKGAGWIFWKFKIEKSDKAGDLARQWSYLEGVRRRYFTKDPSRLHDPNVCDPYTNSSSVAL
ncbi:Glucan endo-1,6-beta-glucosidase B [Leucoagaricus sp. SymC.cos]|nr:Glucan endo-1,6-beta-glucosidase B [Leucoagaricus sp. SymC.cos]